MPRSADEPRPLTRSEITQLFQGIASPPDIPPHVAIEAITATANDLITWCRPAEVVGCLERTVNGFRSAHISLQLVGT